ncbi:MAG: aldehyde dehydrogenase [Rhodoferax sp.]|nr:aldehyde dehydrogenase [Rhodoferax sp.]
MERMPLNFIANAHVPSASGRTLPVIDPSDGQAFDVVQRSNARDVDDAVSAARDGFDGVWQKAAAAERGRLLRQWSQAIAQHAPELVALVQRDAGRLRRRAEAEVAALSARLARLADACEALHSQPAPDRPGYRVQTWREPYGVTVHLLPGHDPLRIFGQDVGAALAAGNVCVVKPAEEASLALLRVGELAARAGFPVGTLNIITGNDQEVGEALARHAGVDHISLTGNAGLATLVQQAAAERHCPVTVALGGARPQIVFADADLDTAVPAIVRGVLHCAGHHRLSGARLLVEASAYEPLLERLADAFEALRVGPALGGLDMGPLVRQSEQQRVWDYLSDAQVAGIAMAAQGVVVDDAPETGFYQAPTLLRDVPLAQALALENVPGPVLAASAFQTEAEAVALANASINVVATHVWTSDDARPLRLARRLRCANLTVNDPDGDGLDSADHFAADDVAASVLAFTTLKTVSVRTL